MSGEGCANKPYAVVAIEGEGGRRTYTYSVPASLRGCVQAGSYVAVPFGRRRAVGYVVALTDEAPPVKLKDIDSLLADEPLVSREGLELAAWMSAQWHAPIGDCLRLFLPPGGRRNIVMRVGLREAWRAEEVRGVRQRAVCEALAEMGGEGTEAALLRRLRETSWPEADEGRLRAVVRALERKGMVWVSRELRRPTARELRRKHARVADPQAARSVVEELRVRAPMQAQVLEQLLEVYPDTMPVAALSPSAVSGLERRGVVVVEEAVQRRRPGGALEEGGEFLVPRPEQEAVIERVKGGLGKGEFTAILLHGVTGSGKTEVYLHCIKEALELGRQAIVLVPEISLTPQIVGRIRARFGEAAALLHSALSAGERFDEWQRLREGHAAIAVGPRSALFAPLRDVGLVVVDEEHETAYKQEASPRYQARAVAWELARRHAAVLLLGSATPAVETYYRAERGEMELFRLPHRIDDRPLPRVHIVDLRQDVFIGEGRTFSEPLLAAMEDTLSRGEQAILFLNRRGFSTFVACRECGWRLECPDCGISLTYHHRRRRALCHYCGYQRAVPDRCDKCGSEDVGYMGVGTERVAERLQRRFPSVQVARMDRDTVRRKGAHAEILARFARGEVQVLVGTQMVAKGLDFPGVTLVGVVNADVGLAWPDFRAAERTFQLLTQVAGRAGRADKPGLVIVQTYNEEHWAIRAAARHDYLAFYEYEIQSRLKHQWPPFVHLARIVFADAERGRAKAAADACALALDNMGIHSETGEVNYKGPSPAPLERLRGLWRFHLVLRAREREALLDAIGELLERPEVSRAGPVVDIDPVDML